MGTEYIVISEPISNVILIGSAGPQGIAGDIVLQDEISVDGEIVVLKGILGNEIKKFPYTGMLKSTLGILEIAIANTDYISPNNPTFTGDTNWILANTDNITIDARTNPRQITLGVFRIEHTAGATGTRPITLDIETNGYGDTHAIVVDYRATSMSEGTEGHILEANIDSSNSTGGQIQVLSVSRSSTGLVNVTAIETLPGVNPLIQKIGDPISLTQGWRTTVGVFTDTTEAFANGVNVPLFLNDNDYIYCGHSSIFNQLEVYLSIKASNTIVAIFEYSTGPGTWVAFSPADGTNGFTTNGSIMWPVLSGWTAASVNGISKYYIRIQRTRNALTTPPTEANIRINTTTEFFWNKLGDIQIRKGRSIGVPVYADRATALTAGLTTGDWYQTSLGAMMLV